MKNQSNISRRNFLGTASLVALGGSLLSFTRVEEFLPLNETSDLKLWSEFSAEEIKLIEKSARAKICIEIESGSCAEKILLTTIRSFKKPDKLVSFAASFGGGIKRGDLCGMLTGAFMSIGFAAERLIMDKEQRPVWVKEKTDELWDWWEELAPIHCSDLRLLYASSDKAAHTANFNRMLQRVALKLDEMFIA